MAERHSSGELAETIAATDSGDGAPPGSGVRRVVQRIGRYEIVKQLGAGGMGIVWEAFDPVLKRGVAIKELRDARGGLLAERLRREAQALAQLSHRNVVTVYDVGEHDGELYIVMQLLGGTTLDRALAELARTPRRVLPLLVQAGRGLEAAHAAGIVHRDFKPTNVLVDGDDVRVSDFGLSRVTPGDGEPGAPPDLGATTTITRGVVGTPAYMSPEQYLGGKITPASDQFSFCVTLWEALTGERPFAGQDAATLRDAVTAGEHGEVPASVPRRIRRVLVRGLARDPQARFASMTELLAELAPRRRALWLGAGVGAAAVGAAAIAMLARPASDPCRDIGAQADAVWTPAQHAALTASLGGLAPGVIAALDDRTARWRAERLDACQATNVRHDQLADVRDQRYGCLEHDLAELRAAIALLAMAHPDPELLSRAHSVVDAIDPSQCSRDNMTKLPAQPRDPRVAALDDKVARADVAMRAGKDAEVIALANTLSPEVVATGDALLAASWFWTLGNSLNQHRKTAEVKAAFRNAAEAATRAGNDAEAVRAWCSLAEASVLSGDLGGVDDLLAVARGAAARSGKPATEIDVALAEAHVAMQRGNANDAIAACHRATAAIERLHVTGPLSVVGYGCLLDEQLQSGNFAAAIDSGRRVLARSVDVYGKDHPETLNAVRMLASALSYHGDLAEARPLWDRVIAQTEQLFGHDSMAVARALRDLASAETPYGETSTPEALAGIRRAVAIGDRLLPEGDPERARLYEALGYVEGVQKHGPESEAALRRAMALYEKLDNPVPLARVMFNLAEYEKGEHHCDEAVPLYHRAAKVAGDTGSSADLGAVARAGAAVCLARAHDWANANADFTSGIADLDKLDEFIDAARARQNYAELLAADGKTAQARTLAQQAIDKLAGKPPPADKVRDEIAAWLKKL